MDKVSKLLQMIESKRAELFLGGITEEKLLKAEHDKRLWERSSAGTQIFYVLALVVGMLWLIFDLWSLAAGFWSLVVVGTGFCIWTSYLYGKVKAHEEDFGERLKKLEE